MEIEVRVVVIPDREKSTDGVIRTDVPLEHLKSEIVSGLALGEASEWELAVVPGSELATLDQLRPADGDTVLLIKKTTARAPAFRPGKRI